MRIVMMGTGTFAEPTFEALLKAFPGEIVGLVTQPDRDVGRRSGASRQTGVGMANIAKAHGIPVIQPESINSEEGISLLKAVSPDLCVVAAYGQIFKAPVLLIPTLGFVNVHASLLPKYRGAAPVAHAILNGENETGVTIFRITTGIDTGEILAKDKVAIDERETTGSLEARLAALGAELIVDVVTRLKAGPVSGEKQDATLATKAPKITKEMGEIHWNQPAAKIIHHIYAMQPWPTAYTFFHRPGKPSMRIICLAATRSLRGGALAPGELTSTREEPVLVSTSEGFVSIEMLQIAGKKPMTAAEFVCGYPLIEGSRFGPEQS